MFSTWLQVGRFSSSQDEKLIQLQVKSIPSRVSFLMEHRLEVSQDGAQLLLCGIWMPVVVAAGIHYFLGFDLCG